MKETKVIKRSNLPTKIPIWSTLLTYLACDYWNAPLWLIGALGTLFTLVWLAVIFRLLTEDEVDIFENKK